MVAARRSLTFVLAAGLLALAACSDSTAPRGTLTANESNSLAAQLGALFAQGFVGSAAAASKASASGGASALAAIPAPFSVAVDVNVPCPLGGDTRLTAQVTGTVENSTNSVTANVQGTHRPNNCGFDVEGKTVRITGTFTATAHAEVKNGVPVGVHTATLVGDFTWTSSDGRKGSCSVNYSATANYNTNRADVNGNFCGSTIQASGPLTS